MARGVHLGHRIDFGLGVLGQFEIRFCVHTVIFLSVHSWPRGILPVP